MADDFIPIKRADVPLTLFGTTEVGHADIVEMDNHIKVNMRIRKDQGVLAQLMERGLVGLTIEFDGVEALHRARTQATQRNTPPLTVGKIINEEIKKGLADCE
jgi:hypothetical protein